MAGEHIYNRIEFDSNEEIEFYQWCEEALEHEVIGPFKYHEITWVLAEKVTRPKLEEYYTKVKRIKKTRVVEETLLKSKKYTLDFRFQCKIDGIFIDTGKLYTLVDVKGANGQYNQHRIFDDRQVWLYQRTGEYVEKIVPEEFFLKTWVPEKARWTPKTGKLKKKYLGYPVVGDFLKNMKGG